MNSDEQCQSRLVIAQNADGIEEVVRCAQKKHGSKTYHISNYDRDRFPYQWKWTDREAYKG